MKTFDIGIMQGRLTEPKGRGIQFFPFDHWKEEFVTAAEIGLQEIEFIFDYEDYEDNPLWTEAGRAKLQEIIRETGVQVKSVCFDYFMRRAFFKQADRAEARNENIRVTERVTQAMTELGIPLIEIPLVDDSSLKSEEEKNDFRTFLLEVMEGSDDRLLFGLETDLPPGAFRTYIDSFQHARVGANYDSGNSSGIGYEPYEEVTTLGEKIFNIHIKDRQLHGTTVALGTGSADFDRLFAGLKEIGYEGSFILQAARAEEGKEKDNIQKQMQFLKTYLERL